VGVRRIKTEERGATEAPGRREGGEIKSRWERR